MSFADPWASGDTTPKGPTRKFEIQTDKDVVILRGGRDEAPDQVLSGRVVLSLKDTITGKVKLRFSRRIKHAHGHPQPGDPTGDLALATFVRDERDIWSEYLVPENRKLTPGDHMWYFNIPIPADSPASLEGPPNTFVIYRLKCVVERGVFAKDLSQKKHVRIHRTFSTDALALQHPMVCESMWDGKCAYKISTPAKGIVYGTLVPMEFRISPLAKGVRPIRTRAWITQSVVFHGGEMTCSEFIPQPKDRDFAEHTCEVAEDIEQDVEGFWTIHQKVPLPNKLSLCTQSWKEESVVPDFEIKHYVNYDTTLSNPDGHRSGIQGRLPIVLYFIYRMHIEATGTMAGIPESSEELEEAAPPAYEQSRLDLLYDEVSHSGYATPIPHSGAATPRAFSVSNLQTLLEGVEDERRDESTQANTEPDADDDENDPAVQELHANTLRNRLDNLVNPVSFSGNVRRTSQHGSGSAGRNSGSQSGTHSPVSLPRNRSFQSGIALGQSPLSGVSMTPAQEIRDPLERHSLASGSPSITVDQPFPSSFGTTTPGTRTPGGSSRTGPTRPASPVHLEDLSRVPSYNTALHTQRPTGPIGSQHGGEGLPTYLDVEVEEAASRSGGVAASTVGGTASGAGAGSGRVTPGGGAGGVGPGHRVGAQPGHSGNAGESTNSEGRSLKRSSIFGGLMAHRHNK